MTPSAARQLTTVPFGQVQNTNQRIINETFVQNAAENNGVRFAFIPISQMAVDISYQRLPQRKVNKIAKEWDITKCGTIKVSFRDGIFYIVDGQNRYLAAKIAGVDRLPCLIYVGRTRKEEALMFAEQDVGKTRVATCDKFWAEVEGGEVDSIVIKNICDEFHIGIKDSKKQFSSHIRSIDKIKRLYKAGGEDGLRWVFSVISECGWQDAEKGYCDSILSSLITAYIRNQDNLNETKAQLVTLFELTTPVLLTVEAQHEFPLHGKNRALFVYISRYLRKSNTITFVI